MWGLTIWRLLWELWLTVPGCAGSCRQGRDDCNCKKGKP